MKIYLDSGHGGGDPGASFGGLVEKNLNLIVAKEVHKQLSEKLPNAIIESTHCFSNFETSGMPIIDRCQKANTMKSDILVSIHHNAGKGQGYEIIHSIHGGDGIRLANTIGTEFEKIGQKKRRIYGRESTVDTAKDFYGIIRHTTMPAIITEYAFIDNMTDREMINSVEKLEKEGRAIANGIISYFSQLNEKQPSEHYAEKHYKKLIDAGIVIHEKRFDDGVKRGEIFALLSQFLGKGV